MPESRTPPNPTRFSYVGQLQSRLNKEADRLMKGLTENDLKAVIALCESLQLDLSIENIQHYDPIEHARNIGKNEAFLQIGELMFERLSALKQGGEEEESDE